MMSYTCIRIEGGLVSPDFLERIHEMEGQKGPTDFGLDRRRSLVDEITSVWSDARSYWDAFQRRLRREHGESTTTITREQWVIPLLEAMGYELAFQRPAPVVDGRTYAISHRAGDDESSPPVHIVASDQELGSRPPSGRGIMSPHALVQDYLNRTEYLWGVVSNGNILRLLRNSSYFTRPSYVEFDLKQMLEGPQLDEFILFYRLAHRTRLPLTVDEAPQCLLESYHQYAIEQGGRIRDGLRDAVEKAILTFGNGFLRHPENGELREKMRNGELSARELYRQLLYLIYRLLFLMVAEERNILVSGDGKPGASDYYRSYFSMARLRMLADEPLSAPERFDDLYMGLRVLFQALRDEKFAPQLGLPPLNGELFHSLSALESTHLSNRDLLEAIESLSYFTPPDERVRRRVNYSALDVEELGSVYESLLDLQPHLMERGGQPVFEFIQGMERKTTGSYYTRPELVNELIKSALEPIMEERLKSAGAGSEFETALLSMKVCDPACGSGHFLLAAARRIGRELARIRTGEEEPSPEATRTAIRDVISHCIYGVDKNPLAVDLCKVALWIEGYSKGNPLNFLDHRIRCGDSLVGVLDLGVLKDGIPDKAFDPVTGDDRNIARTIKRRNAEEREGEQYLPFKIEDEIGRLGDERRLLLELPDDTPEQVRRKTDIFQKIHGEGTNWSKDSMACHLWTGAFFAQLTQENEANHCIPTTDSLISFIGRRGVDRRLLGNAQVLAQRNRFFHWPLEFPEVFENGGFDVLLCNPPWERIKLQEKEFFAARDPEIARAPNKSTRQRLIKGLRQERPVLWSEYQWALHYSEALSKFLRHSDRFPLTARGDINTYSVFTESIHQLLNEYGRAGIICPPGIASDDTTKVFFGDLMDNQSLVSLIAFVNEKFIFPGVLHNFRFCALTLSGKAWKIEQADFAHECQTFEEIKQPERHFTLSKEDLKLLNPNTLTAPVFRTRADAELAKRIFRRVPVLINEGEKKSSWNVSFMRMFDMSNDSALFRTSTEEGYLPLYEAKMMHQFDHRFGSYDNERMHMLPETSTEQYQDPYYRAQPFYYVPESEVQSRLTGKWDRNWLIGFRDVTSKSMIRSATFSLLPRVGIGNSLPLLLIDVDHVNIISGLLANFNSLVFDCVTRHKMAGTHMNFFFVKQLPVLPPDTYTESDLLFITPRVLELVYTSWDMMPFADDIWLESSEDLQNVIERQFGESNTVTGGHEWDPPDWADVDESKPGIPLAPLKWNEERRAILRAELDAYYARLYGLTEEELHYILDPADVYGDDFPGETFRVLKEKEIRKFGEYRTRRLVLEAWEALTRQA